MTLTRALKWIRANLEQTATLSALLAGAAFVANFYYSGFYSFYFIGSESIDTPLADKVCIFAIIMVTAGALMILVARSGESGDKTIAGAFLDNVPFLILLILLTVLALDIYWSNVESISAWTLNVFKNTKLVTIDERAVTELERYLRVGIVVVPAIFPPIVVTALSIRRFSFSRFILARAPPTRLGLLGAYIILTLMMAHACGHFIGWLQFRGVIDPDRAVVTLTNGTEIGTVNPVFLLTKSNGQYYVATRWVRGHQSPKVWIFPSGSVRDITLGDAGDSPADASRSRPPGNTRDARRALP